MRTGRAQQIGSAFAKATARHGAGKGNHWQHDRAAGEREAAEKLNEVLGTRFHQGRQYHGGPESPVLGGDLPGLHVEVKRRTLGACVKEGWIAERGDAQFRRYGVTERGGRSGKKASEFVGLGFIMSQRFTTGCD
jgi:hypothetical protein